MFPGRWCWALSLPLTPHRIKTSTEAQSWMLFLPCCPQSFCLLAMRRVWILAKGNEHNHLSRVMVQPVPHGQSVGCGGMSQGAELSGPQPAVAHSLRLLITQSCSFYTTSKHVGGSWFCFSSTGPFCLNISEKQEQIRKGSAKLWESLRSNSTNRQEGK